MIRNIYITVNMQKKNNISVTFMTYKQKEEMVHNTWHSDTQLNTDELDHKPNLLKQKLV